MDASRGPDAVDPEFDASTTLPTRLRDFDPADHQRLVVNPFLAVLGLIGLACLARSRVVAREPIVAVPLLIPLGLLHYLIQYHCLDCGRTGSYPRHRRHACPGVLARWRGEHRLRAPFPTPWAQLVVWGWLLGAIALLVSVLTWTKS